MSECPFCRAHEKSRDANRIWFECDTFGAERAPEIGHRSNECLLREKINEWEIALRESLKLQAYYAAVLNRMDGGQRTLITGTEEWFERLRATGVLKKAQP